ncbi:MAG: serine/threonine-protein phosphatase [Leptospiraceae bacterium]|nr:serine/threonine-protein phosphatase [Leptospiraceae bacterium]MCP5511991.1 serine/threonine-protein phosphatase [Leptospiraceae bacterium]
MKVVAFGGSDVGKVRENNEDNYLIYNLLKSQEGDIIEPEDTGEGILMVVADGMGGAAAGEKASEIVINTAKSTLIQYAHEKDPDEITFKAIEKAQEVCKSTVKINPEWMGMGSVATYVYIKEKRIYISQVGDTRLYRYRNKTLEQITEDQNLVTELVKIGLITPEQAVYHPQRNAVTQAIGAIENVIPMSYTFDLEVGDKILICSDGLNGMISDIELQLILDCSEDLKEILNMLINTANAYGGHDNITVIIAEILE